MNDCEQKTEQNRPDTQVHTNMFIYARNYRQLTCSGLGVAVTKIRWLGLPMLVVFPLAVRNLESIEVGFRVDIFLVC